MSAEGLDPAFKAKIDALIRASGGKVKIVSGYRSIERQQQLWDAAVKKYGSAKAARKWVAPPGKSNHNHGQAVDLGGDLALARKLAPSVGLHAPMPHEPWHWEDVDYKSAKTAYTTPPLPGGAALPQVPVDDEAAPRKTVEFQVNSLVSLLASGDGGGQEMVDGNT